MNVLIAGTIQVSVACVHKIVDTQLQLLRRNY